MIASSPAAGEEGVSVTRETVLRLSAPLAAGTTLGADTLYAGFGGRRLLGRAELSADRRALTLFYLEPLPANARVSVVLDATGLIDTAGRLIDADGDGEPGGLRVLTFDTAGIIGLPGTAIVGHVFSAEPGAAGQNVPLENVTVTVDGAEQTLRTTTDATGFFRLMPAPAGRFFVHVDGRTALGSQWPGGAYYPYVGKAWEAVAGRTNNLVGGSGEVFLPRVERDALTSVSLLEVTTVRLLTTESAGPTIYRVGIHDASDPAVTTNRLALLDTPGNSHSVRLYRGRAYVADGETGLTVLTYRPPDFAGAPPTILLEAFTTGPDPLDQEQFAPFRLLAHVNDDTAAREVLFTVDDLPVALDGSHPFELEWTAPPRTPGRSNLTVRARATELAGNSVWSEALTIGLVDTQPPRLIAFTPYDGSFYLAPAALEILAAFSEPIAPTALASGFTFTEAGADAVHGTPDDVSLGFTMAALTETDYRLVPKAVLPKGSYRVTATPSLIDRASNPLTNPTSRTFGVRDPLDWATGSGAWGDAGNWSEARPPGTNDFVLIDVAGEPQVVLQPAQGFGELFAYNLVCAEPVLLQGGVSFNLGTRATFNGPAQAGSPGSLQAEANLVGGVSFFRGGLDAYGGLTLRDHTLIIDSPQTVSHFTDASITLLSYIQALGSRIVVQPGSVLDVFQSSGSFAFWNIGDAASQFDNQGTVRKLGPGTLRIVGNVRNQGTLVISEGTIQMESIRPLLENLGTLDIREGATFRSGSGTNRIQRVSNSGRVEILAGTLQSLLTSGSGPSGVAFQQSAGTLLLTDGHFDARIGDENSTTGGRIELSGGELTGTGRITGEVTLLGGVVRPGLGAGALQVNGSVAFRSNAVFEVEIGGLVPELEHDQLRATYGEFDGRLSVRLLGGFQPQIGQEFVIATFDQRGSQQFAATDGLELPGGRRFEVVFQSTRLLLRVVGP